MKKQVRAKEKSQMGAPYQNSIAEMTWLLNLVNTLQGKRSYNPRANFILDRHKDIEQKRREKRALCNAKLRITQLMPTFHRSDLSEANILSCEKILAETVVTPLHLLPNLYRVSESVKTILKSTDPEINNVLEIKNHWENIKKNPTLCEACLIILIKLGLLRWIIRETSL